jgi:hypothetical protein
MLASAMAAFALYWLSSLGGLVAATATIMTCLVSVFFALWSYRVAPGRVTSADKRALGERMRSA